MNKLLTAILAILLLAGALSAISGATPLNSLHPVAIVGEGTSPFPMALSSASSQSNAAQLGNNF